MLVVDAACVVDGDMGHLLMMILCIRPQEKVNEGRVDVAHLSITLRHQTQQVLPNLLHSVNGTPTDLHLSSVTRAQQLTCEIPMHTHTHAPTHRHNHRAYKLTGLPGT